MKQIYTGMTIHADEHGGRLPMTLEELVLTADLTAQLFVCPDSPEEEAPSPTTQQVVEQLRQPKHVSYIFLAPGKKWPLKDDEVLLIEHDRNHNTEGMNVLFGDGHVEWFSRDAVTELMSKLRQSTTRPQ